MKYRNLLFCLCLILAAPIAKGSELPEHQGEAVVNSVPKVTPTFSGVKKQNEYLYTAKKENDLYFVMERIDNAVPDSNYSFWKQFIKEEDMATGRCLKYSVKHLVPALTIGGLGGFRASLDFNTNNEFWVAYACQREVTKDHPVTVNDIEMYVSILTTEDAPMVLHMGISRSFQNWIRSREDKSCKFVEHKGISVFLHSFAAKVIKMRHPKKLYMITAPAGKMLSIFKNALPKGITTGFLYSEDEGDLQKHISDKKDLAALKKPIIVMGKTTYILDKERKQIVWQYNSASKEVHVHGKKADSVNYQWFYKHTAMLFTGKTNRTTIELKVLADYLKLSNIDS